MEKPTTLQLTPPALDQTGRLKIWTIERLAAVISFGIFLPAFMLFLCGLLTPISCEPTKNGEHYYEFMQVYFSECIYNPRDWINFGIGYSCMICWTLCLAPQIILNHVLGQAEDQSFLFYLLWLAGDFTNFIGCLIANQLPTQIGVAVIYLALTILLLSQYGYYNFWKETRHEDENHMGPGEKSVILGSRTPDFSPAVIVNSDTLGESSGFMGWKDQSPGITQSDIEIRSYGGVEKKGNIEEIIDMRDENNWFDFVLSERILAALIVGTFFIVLLLTFTPGILDVHQAASVNGWAMTTYYTVSRLPQIHKIIVTQKVAGLSPIMFIMTFLGNVTYILQVLVVSTDAEYLRDKIPVSYPRFPT